jgi:hypothetical protein
MRSAWAKSNLIQQQEAAGARCLGGFFVVPIAAANSGSDKLAGSGTRQFAIDRDVDGARVPVCALIRISMK